MIELMKQYSYLNPTNTIQMRDGAVILYNENENSAFIKIVDFTNKFKNRTFLTPRNIIRIYDRLFDKPGDPSYGLSLKEVYYEVPSDNESLLESLSNFGYIEFWKEATTILKYTSRQWKNQGRPIRSMKDKIKKQDIIINNLKKFIGKEGMIKFNEQYRR